MLLIMGLWKQHMRWNTSFMHLTYSKDRRAQSRVPGCSRAGYDNGPSSIFQKLIILLYVRFCVISIGLCIDIPKSATWIF